MFYRRIKNRRINDLQDSALRLIYNDYELTFEELDQYSSLQYSDAVY